MIVRLTLSERFIVTAVKLALAADDWDAAEIIADVIEDNWDKLSGTAQAEIIRAANATVTPHHERRWERMLELCKPVAA